MELDFETSQAMIRKRLDEFEPSKTIATSADFRKTLGEILAFEDIDASLLPRIEFEVVVILTFFAPVSSLPANIAESTGLPLEKATSISTMIETLILAPVSEELEYFDTNWHEEEAEERGETSARTLAEPTPTAAPAASAVAPAPLREATIPEAPHDVRERLDLRPEPPVGPLGRKPLTREEVLRAIAPRRTMQSDIESVKQSKGPGAA